MKDEITEKRKKTNFPYQKRRNFPKGLFPYDYKFILKLKIRHYVVLLLVFSPFLQFYLRKRGNLTLIFLFEFTQVNQKCKMKNLFFFKLKKEEI